MRLIGKGKPRFSLTLMIMVYCILLCWLLVLGGCAFNFDNGSISGTEDSKEQLLVQNVAERWQAMIDGNMRKVYEYYDPFFRAFVAFEHMPGLRSPSKYYSYNIKAVRMLGNVAFVDVEVEYSFSFVGSFGQKIERDRTKAVLTNTWLFIDGKWHLKFVDPVTEGTYAHY